MRTTLPAIGDVEIRLLKVFRTVVECGGFSQSQAELGLSVSTISTHISNLETRIGFRLCRRGRSGFAVSEKGWKVYESAVHILSTLEQFRSEVGMLRGAVTGELRIGLLDHLITHDDCKLPEVISKFRELAPDVRLCLDVVNAHDIENLLLRHELDLAIMTRAPESPLISVIDLYLERALLYCGVDHPLASIKDQSEVRSMLPNQAFARLSYTKQVPYDDYFDGPAAASALQLEGVVHLILSGAFVGFLPEHFAQHWVDKGRMEIVADDRDLQIPIRLARCNDGSPPKQADIFWEVAKEVFELQAPS